MKNIKYTIILLLSLLTFSACETYGDYEVELSPIYPLCGEWIVDVKDEAGTLVKQKTSCNTYNTSANNTDKMWIKMGSKTVAYGMLGKVNCSVPNLSFNGDNIPNLLDATDGVTTSTSVTVTNGKITINGFDTASGHKADKIEFTMTNSKYPGKTYTVIGFRKTGWAGEDY